MGRFDNILKSALSVGGSGYYVWRRPAVYATDSLGSKTGTVTTAALDTKILASLQPLTSDDFNIMAAGMLNVGDAIAYISSDLRNARRQKVEVDDLLSVNFNVSSYPVWRVVKVNEVPNTYTELWLRRK